MKIVQVGAISTGTVIILGIAMVIPAFFQTTEQHLILISFSVSNEENLPQWCQELSTMLSRQHAKGAIFFTGTIAKQHPDCVSSFPDNVDIGSQTLNYVDLSSLSYSDQLEEIKMGKNAVDNAGNLNSKLFKAPYGSIDDNIYSELTSSGILADFSYKNQYNKFYDDKFIKFDSESFDGIYYSPDFFKGLSKSTPTIIYFDNSIPVQKIENFVVKLKSSEIRFVSASELTGLKLTEKEGSWI